MASTEAYRPLVSARAGGVCEYCRLVESACGVTFHIEHIVPRCQEGQTNMSNLALSCPGCNLAKAGRTVGPDRRGRQTEIFNPRDFEPSQLGWHLHFSLDRETGIVVARSSVGEATLEILNMNASNRVFAQASTPSGSNRLDDVSRIHSGQCVGAITSWCLVLIVGIKFDRSYGYALLQGTND